MSRPAHNMLNAIALRHVHFYVAVPRDTAALFVCLLHPMTNSMLGFAVLYRRTYRNWPVEAKYNAANDKANFARIRGSPLTQHCVISSATINLRAVVPSSSQKATRMSLNTTALPSLSVRSPFLSRLSTRSCRVRVVQRSHGQIKAHKDARVPQQSLQQTGVQLTGAAGLLVPLMMSNSAMAATPDGEHLLKVCTCIRAV